MQPVRTTSEQTRDRRERRRRRVYDLLSFFADRLKVHLREEGVRHDLIDAVFALPGQDDIALIVKRVEALSAFLETDDGENLLAGVKRAANILEIEEKKDAKTYDGAPDGALLKEPAERALEAAIAKVKFDTQRRNRCRKLRRRDACARRTARPRRHLLRSRQGQRR